VADPIQPQKRRSGRRPGTSKRSIRIDSALYDRVRDLSETRATPMRDLLEQALRRILVEEAASRNEADLAPLVDKVLRDRNRRLETGLRTMMARIGFEVLRSHFVLMNFITEAGIQPSRVNTWHEQGWQYAIKEFRQTPEPDDQEEVGQRG